MNDEEATDKIWDIITNREAIAINQAWAGHPGRLVKTEAADNGGAITQTWAKPIGGGKTAVFVINNDAKNEHAVGISFQDLDLNGHAHVRCVWSKKDLGEFLASYQTDSIGPHDSRLYVLSPTAEAEIVV